MTPKELAVGVLTALVERWISDGKDPHREALRLTESYALRAGPEARFQEAIEAKGRVPGSGV